MRKLVVFAVFLILIFSMGFVLGAEGDTDVEKVDAAYACLEARVADGCSALPADARAFALLTVDECQTEIVADKIVSGADEYWSKSDGLSLKLTAESILALQSQGVNTEASEIWLMNQNKSPNEIEWFLEVDAGVGEGEVVSCEVSYNSVIAKFDMGENKQLTNFQGGGGLCLSLSASPFTNYFLKISNTQQCLDNEYQITCDETFLSTLLFKKQSSTTLHVSNKAHSESAGGFTIEQISSLCFHKNQQCDYEGSLWSALVLDYLHYDVSAFMPYLIVMAEDNDEYMPDSFLYSLTGHQEFKTNLLALQNQQKGFWQAPGTIFDKFYDTAVAGLGLQGQSEGVDDAKRYLLDEAQNTDGCWGSTRDTGFLLYALWGNFVYNGGIQTCDTTADCPSGLFCDGGICVSSSTSGDKLDCEISGYYCMSSVSCIGNSLEDTYDCAFPLVCCDTPKVLETCVELGGSICGSGETCSGNVDNSDASDVNFGENCCFGGTCQETEEQDLCVDFDGECETFCDTDAGYSEDTSLYCPFGDACCVKETSEGGSYWWIWLLLGLIILVVLGIVFRDKLTMLWMRVKPKGKSNKGIGSRGLPPYPPRGPSMTPRTMGPPGMRRPMMRRPAPRSGGEVDDVLKKLREMGQ